MIAENAQIETTLKTNAPLSNRPSIREETITPEMARNMLRSVTPGKEVDKRAVAVYSRTMSLDNWSVNGQTLKFDEKGRVLDGIQRLHACVESGHSFKTLVARGIRADTLHTIDQHRRRNYAGVLEARGYARAGALTSAMSKLIRIENGSFGINNFQIPWALYDRVLDANPNLVEAVEIANKGKSYMLNTAVLQPLVFMALQAGHKEEILEFLERVKDRNITPRQGSSNAPEAFMQKIDVYETASRERGSKIVPYEKVLGEAIKYFNAFLEGANISAPLSWSPIDTKDAKKKTKQNPAPNMGLPKMIDYPGLIDGNISSHPLSEEEFSKNESKLHQAILKSGKDEVSAAWFMITPEMARRWLGEDINRSNRKIQIRHIESIQRDILSGRWMQNAEPICFTDDPFHIDPGAPPRLLNGQHRLHAIVAADQAIEVPIAAGITEEAFATYDTHAKRTMAIAGHANADARVLRAAARFLWKREHKINLYKDSGKSKSPSAGELLDTIERHPGLSEMALLARTKSMRDVGSAGVVAYFLYTIKQEDPQAAAAMISLITDKRIEGIGDLSRTPAMRFLMEIKHARDSGASRKDTLSFLMAHWKAISKWYNAYFDTETETEEEPPEQDNLF